MKNGLIVGVVIAALAKSGKAADADPNFVGPPSRQATASFVPDPAADKLRGVEDVKAWLGRRNLERIKLGTAMSGTHRGNPLPTPPAKAAWGAGAGGHQQSAISGEGSSPSPPSLPNIYAKPMAPTDVETIDKISRLTPRGLKAWMAGSALRDPAAAQSLALPGAAAVITPQKER